MVGRVVSSELCTKGKCHRFVRHVAIDVSGTPLAGTFLVGQSFGVIPPGVDQFGKQHKVRLSSIASPSRPSVMWETPSRAMSASVPARSDWRRIAVAASGLPPKP